MIWTSSRRLWLPSAALPFKCVRSSWTAEQYSLWNCMNSESMLYSPLKDGLNTTEPLC